MSNLADRLILKEIVREVKKVLGVDPIEQKEEKSVLKVIYEDFTLEMRNDRLRGIIVVSELVDLQDQFIILLIDERDIEDLVNYLNKTFKETKMNKPTPKKDVICDVARNSIKISIITRDSYEEVMKVAQEYGHITTSASNNSNVYVIYLNVVDNYDVNDVANYLENLA